MKAHIGLFSAWLEGQIAIRQLPGVVLGVVSGQDLLWAKGFGHANIDDGRPMELDTRFRMASHSKLFTATAIMQLREQGKLRLDDPVTGRDNLRRAMERLKQSGYWLVGLEAGGELEGECAHAEAPTSSRARYAPLGRSPSISSSTRSGSIPARRSVRILTSSAASVSIACL